MKIHIPCKNGLEVRVGLCYYDENTGNLDFLKGDYRLSVYEKVRAYLDDNGLKQVTVAQKTGV